MSRGQSSRGVALQDQRPPPSVTPAQPQRRTVRVKNSRRTARAIRVRIWRSAVSFLAGQSGLKTTARRRGRSDRTFKR